MAKKVLGLDLGTTSIGWAFVLEDESNTEKSEILKLGVRVNPLTTDEQLNFEKGKPVSINAERTLKRSMRRNLQRYKLRRNNLIAILKEHNIITDTSVLAENDKHTTHSTYALRAKAATEQLELEEFARVLLMINKKRGYKSSRKAKNQDEGQLIDGMAIAKRLYEENLTPGQLCYQLLKDGKKILPDFYSSDLQVEFNKVWDLQAKHYPAILTDDFKKEIQGKGQRATAAIFSKVHGMYTAENKGSFLNKKLQAYKWRSEAVTMQLDIREVAYVLAEINNNLSSSSGYLGAISDRSKELYFNNLTIGEYLYNHLKNNPHARTKNQVFYRQDYMDEFEKIWTVQAQHYSQLTDALKAEIRDVIIFYQRKLKSQKGLVSFCEFENKIIEVTGEDGKIKKKTVGAKVSPKSSPLFQEFKIWQTLGYIKAKNKITGVELTFDDSAKQTLFNELNVKNELSANQAFKLLGYKAEEWELNYKELDGNKTNKVLYDAYLKMMASEDDEESAISFSSTDLKDNVAAFFEKEGIDTSILFFDAELDGKDFEKQPSYQLWHLLYSYQEDSSPTGTEALYMLLNKKFGFKKEYATILANITLSGDYGSLSAKAMRKIYPYIKENTFSTACELAGYNHSKSLTKEELQNRPLSDKLEILSKNSLRNPVVEKILNQMVNVVNAIIAEPSLGKPDEIRIELARELKKNASERAEMTDSINKAKAEHDAIRIKLNNDFNIKNPTKNDIIRYKLYEELKNNGYHTLYTNMYIPPEILFTKDIDIDHIIPQAVLFDDSFSNKTLCFRNDNLKKANRTAYDYISTEYGEEALTAYEQRVKMIYEAKDGNGIKKAKYNKLLKKGSEIGSGFIERDLRNTQYIAKKAKQMLEDVCRTVVPTTGSITDRLREDWGLTNVMQELNIEKYRRLGLTEKVERRDGSFKEKIIDWTKRNDHRHHAMDALTVAFTKHSHIQYLNNLHARGDKSGSVYGIEQKETYKDKEGNRKFNLPIPSFREEAKKHLDSILISYKAKNKVVTKNKNKTSLKTGTHIKIELTPRGQLHKETIYGKIYQYATKEEKVGARFDESTILQVANKIHRDALLKRLVANSNDPKKAFTGKNSLNKNPIYLDEHLKIKMPEKVKLVCQEPDYTIRKDITPENFKDAKTIEKVIDVGVKKILLERLKKSNSNPKEAFSNLDKNPIWLNESKGIAIKRVTISGVKNAEPLHDKKDHLGDVIKDVDGNKIPVDFVSTGNNHHVAIYRDANGELQEKIVSFYEAVHKASISMPIIDKTYNQSEGWQFLFTMKQNEYFVFPSQDFDPSEVDLLNPANNKLISPNLFRVQKIATKNYFFRHHLETELVDKKEVKDIVYKNIQSLKPLEKMVKVRVNHIGQIVRVGEY
ncbi:type II CRISPR RNA-guided endonuclease Cas9 [Chitinophagaceae bacterium IBVUCB1]|nr:type II CRISPR RNA-guided endonuclease Cas9 [Chitinophagaceae bacterium IBVUCB1]